METGVYRGLSVLRGGGECLDGGDRLTGQVGFLTAWQP